MKQLLELEPFLVLVVSYFPHWPFSVLMNGTVRGRVSSDTLIHVIFDAFHKSPDVFVSSTILGTRTELNFL